MTETLSLRTERKEEVRQDRRRRSDDTLDAGQALKLAIPRDIREKLAAEGRTPRWINDVGSRVADLTIRDDWDKVEGVEPVEVLINKEKGTTTKAYLVSKRDDFIADDRAKKEAARRSNENAMLKGRVENADNPNTPPVSLPRDFYADPANKIERGVNQIT